MTTPLISGVNKNNFLKEAELVFNRCSDARCKDPMACYHRDLSIVSVFVLHACVLPYANLYTSVCVHECKCEKASPHRTSSALQDHFLSRECDVSL